MYRLQNKAKMVKQDKKNRQAANPVERGDIPIGHSLLRSRTQCGLKLGGRRLNWIQAGLPLSHRYLTGLQA
jgi:hypothetical protein